ncbi:hypothetical protein [Bacillus cereus group sp. MG11]|uniref:hypothetical protein n=1 Tax=Bacillus cereus group sp. MG11 TaxID=3040248 RepID=UPI00339A1428
MEKETMRFHAEDVLYKVEKKKDKYFQIYKCKSGIKEPITHRESFRSACKVAKLLADTYTEGYESGKDYGISVYGWGITGVF